MLQRASPEPVVAPMISLLRQPLPKNYFCLPLPPLPNFFSFSSPSIQFSHPSSFPKVSFNSSPAVPFTPSPSPPSSIFPSSSFYPSSRYPTPPWAIRSRSSQTHPEQKITANMVPKVRAWSRPSTMRLPTHITSFRSVSTVSVVLAA